MRTWIPLLFVGSALLAACGDSSSATDNSGGGGSGGGTGGSTTGGGGTGGTTATGGSGGTGGTTATGGSGGTGGSTTTTASDGCESAGATPVSFANDVQPIFSQSCGSNTTCHLKPTPSESLSLKAGEAYANLVDVNAKEACSGLKRVLPGNAADSYLVRKITDTDICPNTKKMPPSGTLSDTNKQKIIDWVCQGAMNN